MESDEFIKREMKYSASKARCQDCHEEWTGENGGLQILEQQHPEWRNSGGVVVPKYMKEWNEAWNGVPESLCIEIYCDDGPHTLCLKHLVERVNQLAIHMGGT